MTDREKIILEVVAEKRDWRELYTQATRYKEAFPDRYIWVNPLIIKMKSNGLLKTKKDSKQIVLVMTKKGTEILKGIINEQA